MKDSIQRALEIHEATTIGDVAISHDDKSKRRRAMFARLKSGTSSKLISRPKPKSSLKSKGGKNITLNLRVQRGESKKKLGLIDRIKKFVKDRYRKFVASRSKK